MTVYDLLAKLGGVIISNKARVEVDGKTVVVGRFSGADLVPTAEGTELIARLSEPAPPPSAPQPVQSRTRKTRSVVVDSAESGTSE